MKRRFSKILGVGLTLALLTSLLLTAAPVSANVSDISVVLSDYEISATANYTITFKVNVDLPAAATTDTITVVFPEGTDASGLTATGDVKIRNTAGIWGGATQGPVSITNTDVTIATDKRTVTIVVDDLAAQIWAGASVEIVFDNTKVKNPGTAATDLFVTVATSTETTAVASPVYAVTLPTIDPLPGVVELRNPSGILMGNWTGDNAIATAITNAGVNFTINVGTGTYAQDLVIPAALTGLQLIGAEGAVIKGATVAHGDTALRIDASGVTIHGFTIETSDSSMTGDPTIYGIDVANEDVEIYDNVFLATAAGTGTITLLSSTSQGSIEVSGLSIHDNTFTSDAVSTVWSEGIYINCNQNHLDPASTTASSLIVTIADNEFGGNICRAITTERSKTTISGNTIVSALAPGTTFPSEAVRGIDVCSTSSNLNAAQDNVVITGNTVTGFLWGINLGDGAVAVTLSAVSVSGNTLVDNDIGVMVRGADAAGISVNFNDITDSGATTGDYGVVNTATAGTLDATFNWWGTAVAADVAAMKSGLVTVEPFLAGTAGTVVSDSVVGAGKLLNAKDDVGVIVSVIATGTDAAVITAAKYTANPEGPISGAIAFYDVYVSTTAPTDDVTIKFYAGDANTEVWLWSAETDAWVPVTPVGFSTYGGYVYITVDASYLDGTPFALVGGAAAALTAPTIISPDVGEKDVDLRPTFAWTAIAGVLGYEFELADNPNFVAPLMKLSGELGRLIVPYYQYMPQLDYSKAYYWRVRSVDATAESGWVGGVFITVAEVIPEPEEPEWMCSEGLTFDSREALEAHLATAEAHKPVEPPEIIVEPDVEVIVPLPAETQITPAWIYVIIGVGAVLVIALIILIVRTRRVA